MGLKDLMADNKSNKDKKKKSSNQPSQGPLIEEKVNKSIRMKKSTFLLLKKVTYQIKAEDDKYTVEDAVLDGLSLLAKKKGIDTQ